MFGRGFETLRLHTTFPCIVNKVVESKFNFDPSLWQTELKELQFGGVFGFDSIIEARIVINNNINGNVIEMFPTMKAVA